MDDLAVNAAADLATDALKIAMDAHAGQVDKGGKPYILHPIAVAWKMDSTDEIITALLHDVLEDTDVTMDDLRKAGMPENVLQALDCLTHRQGEPYMDYIQRIKGNELAVKVKLADLKHNSDFSRLPEITDRDLERAEKYKAAMAILSSKE